MQTQFESGTPTLKQILVTDLDGTLIQTDMLWESWVRLLFQRPQYIAFVPLWLMRGRSHLKAEMAKRVDIAVENLPFNLPLLDYLRSKREAGVEVVLASASDEKWVNAVAKHLPIFSRTFASTSLVNLKGQRKLEQLQSAGIQQRDDVEYIGDSRADLPLWRAFPRASVVGTPALRDLVGRVGSLETYFPRQMISWKILFRSLRVHQWAKNVLVFVPLMLVHSLDPSLWLRAGATFLAMSLLASSTYIINDLADLDHDRKHRTKSRRPLASGAMSIPLALGIAAPLLVGAFTLGAFLGFGALIGLSVYLCTTLSYSFRLKRMMIWDVMTLSFLYTLRILIGTIISTTPVSHWLLAFSVLTFTGLALLKRTAELVQLGDDKKVIAGRSYIKADLLGVSILGASASFSSIVVFLIYIGSETVREHYSQPDLLFASGFGFVFWYLHLWLRGFRGEVNDDPVLFALKDKMSLFCLAFIGVCTALAI